MAIVTLPLASAVLAEEYEPPVKTMAPVAAGAPEPPLTPTVTGSAWPTTILCDAGVTLTVGVARVTVTEAFPEALLYADELAESGV